MFVHDWQDSVFVQTMLDSGVHLQEFLLSRVSLLDPPSVAAKPRAVVIARISPDFTRPRDIVSKLSINDPSATSAWEWNTVGPTELTS